MLREMGVPAVRDLPLLADDDRELGQLGRALDLRVAVEDLLDQGRSRTLHADDEDRIARRKPLDHPVGEEPLL